MIYVWVIQLPFVRLLVKKINKKKCLEKGPEEEVRMEGKFCVCPQTLPSTACFLIHALPISVPGSLSLMTLLGSQPISKALCLGLFSISAL